VNQGTEKQQDAHLQPGLVFIGSWIGIGRMPVSLKLFDVQTGFGGAAKGRKEIVSADEWLAEMRRLQIAKSLVRILPQDLDFDVPASNAKLFAACAEYDGLFPCPIAVPNSAYDLMPEKKQVGEFISRGAASVFLRPQADNWSLADWCCGKLLKALESVSLPAFCLAGMFTLEQTAELAARYPALPIIIAEMNYGQQRMLLPLLEAFDNVYLSIGNNYEPHKGIEQLVTRIGAERLLFGTGFPTSEPAGAVTQLMYADISSEQREMIASTNAERLIGEIAN